MTTIIQIGNQTAEHATEAAYRDGYEVAGCKVIGIDQAEAFDRGPEWFLRFAEEGAPTVLRSMAPVDLVVYSRTHNNAALGPEWTTVWRHLEAHGTKTASVHLDVFWGLPEREQWIAEGDPLFSTGLVMTADGGSDEKWRAARVNHRWLPPGCDARFIPDDPEPIAELSGKIVFVGSAYGYHSLWPHRAEMIDFASKTWPDRFVIYGNGSPNGPVRGEMLAQVYASDCIVIGDSCFCDTRARYSSDRVPEGLGRRAVLLQACLPDLVEQYPGAFLPWPPHEFEFLADTVYRIDSEWPIGDLDKMRDEGQSQVLAKHTYRHRAREVLAAVGIEVEA